MKAIQKRKVLSFLIATIVASCGAFTTPLSHVTSTALPRIYSSKLQNAAFDEYDKSDPDQGLAMLDTVVGTGEEAGAGDLITVEYRCTFVGTGKSFDSGTISFELGEGRVIPGWEQGLMGMREGGRRTLKIPPSLAYGARGAGDVIPPNSHLQFECTLVKIPQGAVEKFLAQSPIFPVFAGLILFSAVAIGLAGK